MQCRGRAVIYVLGVLLLLCSCTSMTFVQVHELSDLGDIDRACRQHEQPGKFARLPARGCYYVEQDTCHIVVPVGDVQVAVHETRHCYEGGFHGPNYTVDDMHTDQTSWKRFP